MNCFVLTLFFCDFVLKSWCKISTFNNTMQTYFLKFLKIFIFLFIVFTQALDSQGQTSLNKKADSLFIQKKTDEARNIYNEIIENNINVNPKIYLKLANISETKGEFVKELFYLNLYFFKKPDEKVFEKMYNIASENGFSGYEKNDLNYFLFYYRQYSNYVWGGFIILGIYIFIVLVLKKKIISSLLSGIK